MLSPIQSRFVDVEWLKNGSARTVSAWSTPQKRVMNAKRHCIGSVYQQGGWRDAFAASDAARQLVEAGLGEDVTFCAQPDRVTVVPVYAERRITA